MYKQAGPTNLIASLFGKAAPAAKGLGSFPRYPALMAARRSTVVVPNARPSSMLSPNNLGSYNPNTGVLLRRAGLTPDVARETMRHELTHMAQMKAPASWLDRFGVAGLNQPGNSMMSGLRSMALEYGARLGESKGLMSPIRAAYKLWASAPQYAQDFTRLGAPAAARVYNTAAALPFVGAPIGLLGGGAMLKSKLDQLNQARSQMGKTSHIKLSSYLLKMAESAWARNFNDLSPEAQARLAVPGALPDKVRSVSSTPLGKGAEGSVYPSWSPSQGEQATKVFERPIGAAVNTKVDLMRQRPDIFPQITAQHPKGYTMERLSPITTNGMTQPDAWSDFVKQDLGKVRRLSSSSTPVPAQALASAKATLQDSWQSRRNARDLSSLEQKLAPLGNRQRAYFNFTMRDGNGVRYGMRDYFPSAGGGNEWHNIMKTRDGRAVVSDPIFDPLQSPPKAGAPAAPHGNNVTPVIARSPSAPAPRQWGTVPNYEDNVGSTPTPTRQVRMPGWDTASREGPLPPRAPGAPPRAPGAPQAGFITSQQGPLPPPAPRQWGMVPSAPAPTSIWQKGVGQIAKDMIPAPVQEAGAAVGQAISPVTRPLGRVLAPVARFAGKALPPIGAALTGKDLYDTETNPAGTADQFNKDWSASGRTGQTMMMLGSPIRTLHTLQSNMADAAPPQYTPTGQSNPGWTPGKQDINPTPATHTPSALERASQQAQKFIQSKPAAPAPVVPPPASTLAATKPQSPAPIAGTPENLPTTNSQ